MQFRRGLTPKPRLFRRFLAATRRIFVLVSLATFAVSSVGYVEPVSIASLEQAGIRFPCQGRACGCQTAEQCWRGCCCHTVAERLAWARAHVVRPPAYVGVPGDGALARAQRGSASGCDRCRGAKKGCSASFDCSRRTAPRPRAIVSIEALRCQGVALTYANLAAAAPLPPAVTWRYDWRLDEVLRPSVSSPDSLADPPPVPPPRS
jgi:hypothetical protein